jgi:LysR family transcriptional regulator for metE and metH
MELRHLKLIKAITEEGSITKAIDKLHLTQSALSHQLKEAEYQLGTKIFDRINKKMVLTKAGKELYATAIDVLEKMDTLQTKIKELAFRESGEIKLSTECYTSYHWLPSIMRQFQLVYPNVDLKIVMEATHYPLQKLLKGELDIAITSDPITEKNISFIELFQDEMVAVISSQHEWTTKKFVTAKDFVDQNLIIHSLPLETVSVYSYVLKPANVSPKKIIALPLTEASVEMVKADMGIMVMAKWAAQPYIRNSTLHTVKVGRNGLKRTHYAAILKTKACPDYLSHFITFLRNEIQLQ